MAWPNIDPTSPAPTDKVKFGDDVIRTFKSNMITALQKICNFQDNAGTVPALKTAVWTTAGRPTGGDLVDKVTGYNTTLGYEEYYDAATTSWKTKGMPSWAVASRPTAPISGVFGYNTDLAVIEWWSGSAWVRVSGGRRGDIKMWSGAVNDIETGWVLADGVQRTHPEGGNYTPPDLRNRFIVGAGSTYAVGATGGEATHTLTTAEMPSHNHSPLYGNTSEHGNASYVGYTGILVNTPRGPVVTIDTSSTGYTGGGAAHENRPPYYALCYLYKL